VRCEFCNRAYRYDFFFDNCATRLKDIVVQTLPNSVRFNDSWAKPTTFRRMVRPYLSDNPLLALGIHLGLGSGADAPADAPSAAPAAEAASARVRAPSDCRDLAVLVAAHRDACDGAVTADAAALMDLLQACDALRRPERFADWLAVCRFDGGAEASGVRLERARTAAASIDAGEIARAHPEDVPGAIRAARIAVISAALTAD